MQKLGSTLKQYFPLIGELFGKNLAAPLVTALVRRWSTLKALQRAHPKTLQTFFKEQGVRGEDRRRKLCQTVRSATPLTTDAAIVDTHALYAENLCRQLETLVASIARLDEELSRAAAVHEDAALFRSLPGAGDVLVPRLIAAFGSDRDC